MIKIENLTKSYRTPAGRHYVFKDLNIEIPSGKSVAFIGRNGAGKSTLLRMIGGIDRPDSGKIITIHRIGSSDITTETDLVLAVQQSVMAALDENGIDNQGSASMKDSFLEDISKPINRTYFDSLIKEDDYAWEFPEMSVDDVERIITGDNAKQSEEMLRKVMTVMKNIGQYGILKDTNAMSDWIKDIIEKNNTSVNKNNSL